MEILALIPARGGSKGVPKKNIKLLDNFPLLSYSIAAAKLSQNITRVIVSTDSQEIADIAQKFGAEVPFLRPKHLANDISQDIDFVQHCLEYLETQEGYTPDYIVLLRPTTPLRETAHIDKAIEKFQNTKNATSLRSSHEAPESPFKWFGLENEFYTSICEEVALEETNKPRQSFKSVYVPNGYVDILKPDYVKNSTEIYGKEILSYITPDGYEIDTLEEFEYIEYRLVKKGTELHKYLDKK